MRHGAWTLSLAFWVLAGPAAAEQPVARHTLEFGPELYYHNYEEPGVMEEEAAFWGFATGYEYHRALYGRAEARMSWGEVDYASPVSGTLDGIDDWLFESRLAAGYDLNVDQTLLLSPFFGLGYRYLNDDSSGMTSTTGAAGYERESNYFYSPLGVAVVYKPAQDWRVRASTEYDFFWLGRQESHLSDAVAGVGDLHNDQDEGYGLRGTLGLDKAGQQLEWRVEGFIRYWNIEDSDLQPITYLGQTIGLGYEPANETIEAGAVIGVRF